MSNPELCRLSDFPNDIEFDIILEDKICQFTNLTKSGEV